MNNRLRSTRFLVAIVTSLFLISTIGYSASLYYHNKFISYNDIGEGKSLVLIHAFPTDKRLWSLQEKGLAKKFRVISLDLWGFGESSSVDGSTISMTDYAEEVHQLLHYLHIEKAIIGGESMGGYIALAFLEKYPSQVEGLILSNTQANEDDLDTKASREKLAAEIIKKGSDSFVKNFLTKALSPKAAEDTKAYLSHILVSQKPAALASALRGMSIRNKMFHVLANSDIPILIITSDQDIVISSQKSEEMHAITKNSQLITISNAGHLSNLEQPEQWNNAVINAF
ncbi:alpha/beta hydrolase [Legionella busanensis]|uniref:Alpha/beta hydrolase n=1 Tax=Legionella busanensis TaxID=190655 RepID=A0A378KCY1_9GAMM|nr:alpha/beta hydrolase [Legionella busanensis]STX81371.1 alpha/beta hydrolase [Legionella busanensis]